MRKGRLVSKTVPTQQKIKKPKNLITFCNNFITYTVFYSLRFSLLPFNPRVGKRNGRMLELELEWKRYF